MLSGKDERGTGYHLQALTKANQLRLDPGERVLQPDRPIYYFKDRGFKAEPGVLVLTNRRFLIIDYLVASKEQIDYRQVVKVEPVKLHYPWKVAEVVHQRGRIYCNLRKGFPPLPEEVARQQAELQALVYQWWQEGPYPEASPSPSEGFGPPAFSQSERDQGRASEGDSNRIRAKL